MSRTALRRAFTLVELLMVIMIIGMLIALLLPAINAARESGRNNTCKNNLRQVAMAIVNYESKRSRYPGAIDAVQLPAQGGGGQARYVWRPLIHMILPQLERNDLYELSDTRSYGNSQVAPEARVYLPFLVCPSDLQPASGTPTSYVYNTGMPGPAPSTDTPWGPWHENVANGVLHFRWRDSGYPAAGGISSEYITGKDGTSTTLMLTENIDAGNWTDFEEVDIGWVWHDVHPANPPLTINSQRGERAGSSNLEWARPSGNHLHAVNVAFCDGHVRSLRQDIHYFVLVQLMTPFANGCGYDQTPAGRPQNLSLNPRDYNLQDHHYN